MNTLKKMHDMFDVLCKRKMTCQITLLSNFYISFSTGEIMIFKKNKLFGNFFFLL